MTNERRSAAEGTAADRIDIENDSQSVCHHQARVGGRQGMAAPLPVGGGYLPIYTALDSAVEADGEADPRLGELRTIGLPRTWLRIARQIGFDAFMGVWQVLMAEGHVDDRNRVVVPNMARYLRYQRNKLIQHLATEGKTAEQIHRQVRVAGENLAISHIRRVMAAARIDSHVQ